MPIPRSILDMINDTTPDEWDIEELNENCNK